MAAIQATRSAAADPASVALLLAGPMANGMFSDDSGLQVEVAPPDRAGIGFGTSLTVRSDDAVVAWGSMTIQPAAGVGTTMSVALQPVDGADRVALQRWLTRALSQLAAAALARASAA